MKNILMMKIYCLLIIIPPIGMTQLMYNKKLNTAITQLLIIYHYNLYFCYISIIEKIKYHIAK